MITEDYCSFEVSKLLKEKGFIGDSEIGDRCGFYEQNKEYPNQINLVYDDLNNSELEWNECLRFTHQMAMKWLREEKYIILVFKPASFSGEECTFWTYEIWAGDNFEGEIMSFKTYEEAVDAALKHVLENLI